MSEGVITNLMTFVDNAPHQVGICLPVFSDDEKCGRSMLLFQDVKNRRRPARVWPIVKRQCDHSRTIAAALNDVRRRGDDKLFIIYETVAAIDVQIAPAVLGTRDDLQQLAGALKVNFITIDDAAQNICRRWR